MPKSWDIRPSSASAPRAVAKMPARTPVESDRVTSRQSPARVVQQQKPVRAVRPETHLVDAPTVKRPTASSVGRGVLSLRERRKKKHARVIRLACGLLFVICVGVLVLLWQPFLRVQAVEVTGPHADELPGFVRTALEGSRYGLFPKNSLFFIPTEALRQAILTQYPDIEAVSFTPSGLRALRISGTGRATAFWWCGTTYQPEHPSCFESDTGGKIFNPIVASTTVASTTPFIIFSVYHGSLTGDSPLGGSIENSDKLPNMFRFVKTLKSLGAPVVSAQIRGDEADIYTHSGMRITYVLGREEQAVALAATAFPTLDIQGNELLYIDLRFASKIYFKKRDGALGTPTKVR